MTVCRVKGWGLKLDGSSYPGRQIYPYFDFSVSCFFERLDCDCGCLPGRD